MGKTTFITILIVLALIGLSFLTTCGVTWVVLYLLAKTEIATIKFSWALGLLVWIVLATLRSIFKQNNK